MQIFEVFGDVILNDPGVANTLRNISRAVDHANQRFTQLSNMAANVGSSLMQLGSRMTQNVTKPILNVVKDSVMLASDLNEAYNVVDTTFKKNAAQVKDWSKNLLDDFGLVQLEAINYVGSMGAMLKSSGIGATAARLMSQNLVELTGDMSSFYNLSHEETWEKIRAGISGETEPLKSLGINMSIANLEAFALKEGITATWKEMDQGEQVALRYSYLMSITKDVQGDFAKTADSFSNKLRVLAGRFGDLKMALGQKFLPYANIALDYVMKLVVNFAKLPPGIQQVILIFGALAAAIGPVTMVIGGVIIAFGAVAGAIAAVGAPVAAVIASIGVLVSMFTAYGAIIVIAAAKTGYLQKALNYLKNAFGVFISIIKGDFFGAMGIMESKLGISHDAAMKFASKAIYTRTQIIKLGDVAKSTAKLILDIFSGKKQSMINLMVEKFGVSRAEAKRLSDMIMHARDTVKKMAQQVQKLAGEALHYMISQILKVTKHLYDNRASVLKGIEAFIKFASTVKKVMTAIYNTSQTIKKTTQGMISAYSKANDKVRNILHSLLNTVKKVFSAIISQINKVPAAFNRVKSAISGVISKVSNLHFPSMPSWMPGFASGVRNFSGGLAVVGEEGPEIVRLPPGSDVIPNEQMNNYVSPLREINTSNNKNQNNITTINLEMKNNFPQNVNAIMIMNELKNLLKGVGVTVKYD
jgi:hypothetical protein